jgi:hypothetical protein
MPWQRKDGLLRFARNDESLGSGPRLIMLHALRDPPGPDIRKGAATAGLPRDMETVPVVRINRPMISASRLIASSPNACARIANQDRIESVVKSVG